MRRLLILCLFPCLLAADDHWVKFTSGPFEVLTDAGARAGRETMVRFEEFRHALGEIVGEPDLETPHAGAHPGFQQRQGLGLARAPHRRPRLLRHRAGGKERGPAGGL